MHETIPVRVHFYPNVRSGIYLASTSTRVLDGVAIGQGMFECILRAKKISGLEIENGATPAYNPEAKDYFEEWIKPLAHTLDAPVPQSLQVYGNTVKLFESSFSPWVTNAFLPWIDVDMYDPSRKILGVSPHDVRSAINKHGGIARPAEIAGNDAVEVRVAFLCAGPTTTHPEPLEIDFRPQQVAFFKSLQRPDLIYQKRGTSPLRHQRPS